MKVQFVIEDESLLADKEIHPQPISNYAPDWFKNLNIAKPKNKSLLEKFTMTNNVKSCPSFIDVYQDGFVILAPNDYILAYDENTGYYEWRVAAQFQRPEYNTKTVDVSVHSKEQMIEHLPSNSPYKKIFKFNLPMKVITPNGYSMRQLPIPYSFNKDYEAAYGILRTDKHHEVNIQMLYKSDKEEILIKRGTPLCVFAPFKRDKFSIEIVNNKTNKKIRDRLLVNENILYASFGKKTKNTEYFSSE
jgi:hypothetical protein